MKLLKFLYDAGLYDEFMELMEQIADAEKDIEDYEKNPEKYDQEEIEFLKNDLPDFRNELAKIKSDFMKEYKNLDWDREVEDAKAFKVTREQLDILYIILEKLKNESVEKYNDEKMVCIIKAYSDEEFNSLMKIIYGSERNMGLLSVTYETYPAEGIGCRTKCFSRIEYSKPERTFQLILTADFKKFILKRGYI